MPIIPKPVAESVSMNLPNVLQVQSDTKWEAFSQALARTPGLENQLGDYLEQARRVFALSDFVADSCTRNTALLAELAGSGDLRRAYANATCQAAVAANLDGVPDNEDLMVRLRRLRQREMVRIAWRDLCGLADLGETLADLTRLAEACLGGAHRVLSDQLAPRFGHPFSR